MQWLLCRAAAAAALVKQNDAGGRRIEQLPVLGTAAAAGTAVQEDDRQSTGRAAFFKIHAVAVLRRQKTVPVGLDRGEQIGVRVFIHDPPNASRFARGCWVVQAELVQTLGGSHEILEVRFHVLPIGEHIHMRHSTYLCSEWLCTRFAVISGIL